MTKILVGFVVVIILLIILECIREITTFKTTHYYICSPKWKNCKARKLVLLSDLHNYQYGKNNEKLLKAVRDENPDLILIAGDMLVGKAGASPKIAKDFVEKLPGICKTFYANGNHEQRMKLEPEKYGDVFEEYKTYLEERGVHFLSNEKACMKWEDSEMEILGLDIPKDGYGKFCKVSIPGDYVESCFGKKEDSKFQVLIAHNPLFVKEYLKWGADMIVCGHLHGGVARVPLWRGVISPQGGLFPKYSGELTKEGDTSVVVSKGVGLHTIPVRFLNPAEIVVLHIGDSEE